MNDIDRLKIDESTIKVKRFKAKDEFYWEVTGYYLDGEDFDLNYPCSQFSRTEAREEAIKELNQELQKQIKIRSK
jgi:hypothetical protein